MSKLEINPSGNLEESPVPPDDQAMIDAIKSYILQSYHPVFDPTESDKRMSTQEIFDACCRIYHNELFFSRNDLAKFLQINGFKIWDAGDMRFEWLMKTVIL